MASPHHPVAVPVLDHDGEAGQLVHRAGDPLLTLTRRGCRRQPPVDIEAPLRLEPGLLRGGHRLLERSVLDLQLVERRLLPGLQAGVGQCCRRLLDEDGDEETVMVREPPMGRDDDMPRHAADGH